MAYDKHRLVYPLVGQFTIDQYLRRKLLFPKPATKGNIFA